MNKIYKPKPTEISYSIDTAMKYGEMPNEALVKKFEETEYLNDSEDLYDDYSRGVVKDRSVDTPAFESDEPRKSYNSKGFLNLLHSGGRGEFNNPDHSEMFLGLTDTDPRGINVDPDMRKMVEQEQARMRFVRFGNDTDNSVHHGVWSEKEAYYKARILTQKAVQPRAQIFSTSKDGRREGIRRDYYDHKSNVNKVEEDLNYFRPQSTTFTDYITNWALNPQRSTVKISNKTLENSRMFQATTTDNEFHVARYGEDTRRQKQTTGNISKVETSTTDMVHKTNEDQANPYKAVGILMGAIVTQKHHGQKDQSGAVVYKDELNRKTQALQGDLIKVLHEVKTDTQFVKSDEGVATKTAPRVQAEHLKRTQLVNHSKPSHLLFNAELMYKGLKPTKDSIAIKSHVITDDNAPKHEDLTMTGGKSAVKTTKTGTQSSVMEVDGKSLTTVTFARPNKQIQGPSMKNYNGENLTGKSDITPNRKQSNVNYRVTTTKDVDPDTVAQFSDNSYKQRYAAPLGEKSKIRRFTDTEHSSNEISLIN